MTLISDNWRRDLVADSWRVQIRRILEGKARRHLLSLALSEWRFPVHCMPSFLVDCSNPLKGF